jgi:hypothetical protein
MSMQATRAAFIAAFVAAFGVACGSGGADGTGSGTSSGGSSGASSTSSSGSTSSSSASGAVCGAQCQSGAAVSFEESNAGGRLDGAVVEACRNSKCVSGTLTPPDSGSEYTLAGFVLSASVTATGTGSLHFSIAWSLNNATDIKDGDVYSVTARASDAGPPLFTRTFTATYTTMNVCGSVCENYSGQ